MYVQNTIVNVRLKRRVKSVRRLRVIRVRREGGGTF